ncbi:LTA synthase family protein [uncultured Cloacibacillus sp.]|uniref:LTA synthase family protein n=1 Tax=uncultured Cloacibacillus sp. TaxID=889794 RepID=UPI002635997F|nr:LTA synthase family protein [uncultured Cloacibacillus sp.]
MNYFGNSIAGYRAARGDRRELIFFALWAFVIFLKFFGLECEVWGRLPRAPLAYALSASLCAAFAVALSLLPRRARFACALVLDFAFSALIVTDLLHLRFYSDLFTFHNFGLSGQVGDVSDSVFALLSPRDALYFCDILLFFVYYLLAARLRAAPVFGALGPKRAAASCAALALSLGVFAVMLYGYDRRMPNALAAMWDRPAVCCNVGAMPYHAADARNVLRESFGRKKLSADEIAAAAEEFAAFRAKLAPPYPAAFGAARGKNLIMIQAESLQSFAVGLRVNGREVTPNLNRFAREASFAGDLYVQTGLGNSADSEFLANAGLYPARSGVAYVRFADRSYDALPRLLRARGYAALAMHGDRAGFWNRAHMYPALGFERFVSKKDYEVDEVFGLGLSDGSFFRQSLAMLEAQERPFYAFLVTLSSHYPFGFPELLKAAAFDQGDEAEGAILRSYLAAIHYFDREFGKFIDGLKSSGLYYESVIILYGDHAAIPKWDAASLAKLLGKDLDDEHSWRAVNTVPLMVRVPGVATLPHVRGRALGQVDIPATAASLLGFEFSSGFGRNIFAPEPASAPVIFRSGDYVSGGTLVEPAKRAAVDLADGRERDYLPFAGLSSECARELALSDKILEYGLRFPSASE